jgi:hypothetical protein
MEPVPIDRTDGHDPDADRGRAHADGLEERLALVHRHLLGVVQRRQRPHTRTAKPLVVEEHTRDDERSGKRPAAGLVRACDATDAELAVEPEETLAARSSHAAENTD